MGNIERPKDISEATWASRCREIELIKANGTALINLATSDSSLSKPKDLEYDFTPYMVPRAAEAHITGRMTTC